MWTQILPNNLLTKGWTLNGSKSSVCSPVPMKMTGLFVAATLKSYTAKSNTLTSTIVSYIVYSKWSAGQWKSIMNFL